ncbi:MAG: CCA tRNA nucleotidyltransferase [Actinobacteria bacterium]|nr:MAG: CCA tRNA nucleotidyltransferase [Actinomycetota bacterium]
MNSPLHDAAALLALTELERLAPEVRELASRFCASGRPLGLVGGCVRDAILGRLCTDLDFTTAARPAEIKELLQGWCDSIWETGIEYGTISGARGDLQIEITTYRSELYDPESRKPQVKFGDSLEGDLRRRDFTINAMALVLEETGTRFVDPFGGVTALNEKRLSTPGTPEESFSDDPLRIMRAIRFAAQLGVAPDAAVLAAIGTMKERLSIISAERIREEFNKLLMSDQPRVGLSLMVSTGVAEFVIPELPKLKLEIDEHHRHKDVYEHSLIVLEQAIGMEDRLGGPNLIIRLAALLHDIGKPKTRALIPGGGVSFHHHEVVGAQLAKSRLKAMRYSNDIVNDVTTLVELHLRFHGYGSGEWTDSAVRRYVRDAEHLLTHLHVLTRSDCTTRNARKAAALAATYDDLEIRIARLAEEEELASLRPDLDGNEIMEILEIKPSRLVGAAYDYLMELRLDRGPLGREVAISELKKWWMENPQSQ